VRQRAIRTLTYLVEFLDFGFLSRENNASGI
jgi:hypothetical protein